MVREEHVFIEPDEHDRWRLIMISTYSGNGAPVVLTVQAYRVVRVDGQTQRVIPTNVQADVGDYGLYYDANGELLSLDL